MDQVTFNVTGFDKLYEKFRNVSKAAKVDIKNEFNASALKIQNDAKRLAPVNFGQLRNSIVLTDKGDETSFKFTVSANAKYAPYVEFGTGPMAEQNIPSQYREYAQQFKGKTGSTFKQMVDALTLWVQRKGIGGKNDKATAYLIARSILRKGLRPQPFLFPAFEQEEPKLRKRIKDILNAKS